LMVLTSSACAAWEKTPPTMPVATSPSTARRPVSPSADALTTALLALLAARLLGAVGSRRSAAGVGGRGGDGIRRRSGGRDGEARGPIQIASGRLAPGGRDAAMREGLRAIAGHAGLAGPPANTHQAE
jgi:hypothetical protein